MRKRGSLTGRGKRFREEGELERHREGRAGVRERGDPRGGGCKVWVLGDYVHGARERRGCGEKRRGPTAGALTAGQKYRGEDR